MVAGEPGGGEPAMRAKLEAGWGASVTEAMGIGDISVSLWGECEQKAGMHFSGRGFVHFELIDPETGARRAACRRRGRRTRAHPSRQSLGAAPALPHPRPCAPERGPMRLRAHEPARALHRAHRRHADRARRQRLSLGGARGRQRVRARGRRRHHDPPARRGRQAGAAAADQRRGRAGSESRGPRGAHPRSRARQAPGDNGNRARAPGALPRSEYKSKLVEKV